MFQGPENRRISVIIKLEELLPIPPDDGRKLRPQANANCRFKALRPSRWRTQRVMRPVEQSHPLTHFTAAGEKLQSDLVRTANMRGRVHIGLHALGDGKTALVLPSAGANRSTRAAAIAERGYRTGILGPIRAWSAASRGLSHLCCIPIETLSIATASERVNQGSSCPVDIIESAFLCDVLQSVSSPPRWSIYCPKWRAKEGEVAAS